MTDPARSYQEPTPTSTEAVQADIDANNILDATLGMVGLAYYSEDWRGPQNLFLRLLDHPAEDVRATAAICLSHLARIHHQLDHDHVLPVLRRKLSDPQVGGTVEDAIADIEQFLELGR